MNINLQDFLKSNDSVISGAAQQIDELNDKLTAGEITRNEFDELMNDLLDINQISKKITDIKRKSEIAAAFEILKQLVSKI